MPKTCYIVAGGASLKDFDWSYLDDKKNVFAINRAYETCPNADHLYWVDCRFWEVHSEGILAHNAEHKITMFRNPMRVTYPDSIEQYKYSGQKGYDERDGYIKSGNNSGYSCLSLCISMGFKHIYLLGFDMCFTDGHSHFHDGHHDPRGHKLINVEDTLTTKMLPYFQGLKEATDHITNLTIINTNFSSAITCFKFGALPR